MDMQATIFLNFITSIISFNLTEHTCIFINNLKSILFVVHVFENIINKNGNENCLNFAIYGCLFTSFIFI
jgi:hypothetical protein